MAVGSFKLPNTAASTTPTVTPYVRPTDWLTMPTPGTQEVIGLMAVYDDDSNYVALTCAGNYTVDWGDGTITNYASGVAASRQHTFSSLSSGTLTSKGFRQALVRITPQAGHNLTSVSFSTVHPTFAKSFAVGWLEFDIRTPNALPSFGGGSNVIRYARLEKITIRETGGQSPSSLFANLYSLKSVYIEPSEMTTATNFSNMFGGCNSLEEAPLFDTSSGTNFQTMFVNCYMLQSVPLYNLSASTTVISMFDGCKSLLTIPAFVLGTSSSALLYNAPSIIEVPLLNTSNVLDASYMFSGCNALRKVALLDTGKVTNFTFMFQNCNSLENVPLFNTILGQNFTSMFSGCNSLTEVPLFNMIAATNLTQMFNGSQGLIYVPAFNTVNVTTLSQTFNNCYNLRELPALNLPVCTVFTTWLGNNTTLSKSGVYGATRGHSYSNMALSQANIVTIFNNLGTASGAQTITVSSNPGYAGLTAAERLIATNKNWTIA